MKRESIWTIGVKDEYLPSLQEDISCDILIIGGGMAGLSLAYELKDEDKKIVLIEKSSCGSGATSHNTGKLTFMQDLIYNKIASNYNEETSKLYYDSQIKAIGEVLKIIKDNKISCHLNKTKSYVFSTKDEDKDFNKEIEFYKKNNINYRVVSDLPNNYPSKYALETDFSYAFNPYEYLVGIKNIIKDKINIYEKTRCVSVSKKDNFYEVKLSNGRKITSKAVAITSHYPMFIIPFLTPFKTKVEKFFIGAGLVDKSIDIQMISHDEPSISMRYYNKDKDNYLIYGRRSHSVSKKLDVREDFKELEDEYKKYFGKKIDYFYHTHDIMTYDSLPFIGKIKDNLYIATGFNKWGNTNGALSGMIISDLIMERDNKYRELFDPKRSISFDKIKNLPLYNIETGSSYVINKLNPNKNYYEDDVKVKLINGKRCGIYIDKDKNEHIVSNICPHMKCNLIFNYVDKTWDCPCHGSRFDIDGNIIYGPSVYNIKIKDDK